MKPHHRPGSDAVLRYDGDKDRRSLELDGEAAELLDATQGDVVLVTAYMLSGETRELVAIAGTRRKSGNRCAGQSLWIADAIDVQAVEQVTVRRRRRV